MKDIALTANGMCAYVFLSFQICCLFTLEREREKEKHRCVRETWIWIGCFLHAPLLEIQTKILGMYPDQESNQGPFWCMDDAQSAEPHWPDLYVLKISF